MVPCQFELQPSIEDKRRKYIKQRETRREYYDIIYNNIINKYNINIYKYNNIE